jgi:membrane-bound lytic murein transglycosylase D
MPFIAALTTFFCILLLSDAHAQVSFDRSESDVLKSSSEQWLCRELKAVNPAFFNCQKREWKLPNTGRYDLFGDSITLSSEQVTRYERIWFPEGDCRIFLSVVAIADVYMPLFKRKAELLSLHSHVAYIPVIVSGCNQQFREGDVAGLWALGYLAARKEHLAIDTLVDERLGGDFTTDAALNHFRYMLKAHGNDYWKAIIAYRYGPSELPSIDQIRTATPPLSKSNSDAAEFLRFMAYTIRLFKSVHLDNQLNNCFDILGHYQAIQFEKPLRVEAISKVLALDENRLREINPVYTGAYLIPGYRKVPFVLEDTIMGRFRLMLDSISRWQPVQQKIEAIRWETDWISHRVAKGESLGRIASKYSVSISQLKKWNHLRNDKIRKGQVLKIEKRKKVVDVKPATSSEQISTVESADTIPKNKITPAPKTANQSKADKQQSRTKNRYYTVKQGDSLWSIAKKYPGVTENDLMRWNNCNANIQPGQKLIIKNVNP